MRDFDKAESLFHQALQLPADADRQAWLEARCEGDSRLVEEISGLLEARAEMANFVPVQPPTLPSAQFGVYRAVELVGRGGMSAVYRAERADGQFQQTVAVKVMAGYLISQEFLHRFETERRLLASLHHPNITRLLDGGISSAGDPFLVTDFVDGQSIDRYCDRQKLSVRDRVQVFLQVCDAVDHAHRNLIVHRDLKPANILVDRGGIVKLLDFGTASLLATHAEVTVTRLRMLTPRYASPEQLRGQRVNISTDIYSLGVVLYELLTGAWPFGDPKSILRELDRSVEDVAAKPPSTVVTEESAEYRSVSLEHLGRALKGDLSAIVLKALECDPARRYESVRALAADLQNFLDGRPVAARPQTAVYRARKFLRRRWLPVGAAAVFVLGLAGAAVVAIHQAGVARAEADKAEKVNEFLNDMLGSPGSLQFDAHKVTVAEMVETAEQRLENSWKGDARTEATLRRSLGLAYSGMARFDRARPELEKSIRTFEALGEEKDVAIALYYLAVVASGEGRYDESVKEFERVIEISKHPRNQVPSIVTFQAENQLASIRWLIMRSSSEARPVLEAAIALGERDLSIPRVALATALSQRAGFLSDAGKRAEAESAYRRALAVGRQEDPDGYWQASILHFLALLIAPENLPEATELAHEYYRVCQRNLGAEHPDTAASKLFWMRERAEGGETVETAPVLEAIATVRKGFPPPSMNLWVALTSAIGTLNRSGSFRESEVLARELLPILDANPLPKNDPRRGQSLAGLARALEGEKKNAEAIQALQQAATIFDAAGPAWAANAVSVRKRIADLRPASHR